MTIFIRMADASGLEKWRSQIEKALRHGGGEYEYFDIEERIETGHFTLFECEDAFAVVQPKEWPTQRVVHILLSGGTFEGMKKLGPIIEDAAKRAGASKLTSACRLGFAKRVKSNGWKTTQIYVEKEL